MKNYLFYIICFFSMLPAFADGSSLKEQGDAYYAQDNFEEAAKAYLKLTEEGDNADVFFNLGNCYYRMKDIAHSILWYERALLLSPGDGDIRYSLRVARSKVQDNIKPEEELFFVRWYNSFSNIMSVNAWVRTGIILFVLMLVCLGFYFLATPILWRKCGFYSAIVLFAFVILSNVFAWQQHNRLQNRDGAIVMAEEVVVKSTPNDTGTDLFVLHAGTKLTIVDNSMSSWYQVVLSDGKKGWIPSSSIEII